MSLSSATPPGRISTPSRACCPCLVKPWACHQPSEELLVNWSSVCRSIEHDVTLFDGFDSAKPIHPSHGVDSTSKLLPRSMPCSTPCTPTKRGNGQSCRFWPDRWLGTVRWLRSLLASSPRFLSVDAKSELWPWGSITGLGLMTSSVAFRCRTSISSCCSGGQWRQPTFRMIQIALFGDGRVWESTLPDHVTG